MRADPRHAISPRWSNSPSRSRIDFAVIAADAQLVGGLWDVLEAAGIRALGPSKAAAVLEGSKGFVKDLCREAGIPTAAYQRFTRAGAGQGLCRHARAIRW